MYGKLSGSMSTGNVRGKMSGGRKCLGEIVRVVEYPGSRQEMSGEDCPDPHAGL